MASVPAPTASAAPAAFLYPVALNVRGRRCVIIGGGSVGARKAAALMEAGADVLIVAPEIADSLATLIAEGRIAHRAEPFTPEHLEDAFLAIAATDRADVNRAVVDAARERGVLLNVAADAGDSEAGDFATMAAVRRGDLVLGVTTGGAGPALAAQLRRDLETRFGPEWKPYTELLGSARTVARQKIADPERRAQALRRLAASAIVREKAVAGETENAWEEAMTCLFE